MDSIHLIAIWAALAASLASLGAWFKIWMELAERSTKVKDEIYVKVDELREEREQAASIASGQISTLQASFSLYRENTAKEMRDFITRDMLRDFEQRIERSTKESSERVFAAIADYA